MLHSEHSLTTANAVYDKNADSSDLLSMLQVIERLYAVSHIVINSHSAAAILFSLTVEVQMLLTKLRAMRQRWTIHLPFKEASSVDFVDWSNRAAQLASAIQSSDIRNCLNPGNTVPSSHCLLDIYEQTVEPIADNSTTDCMADPIQLLNYHAAMLKELTSQRKKCVDAISQLTSKNLADYHGIGIAPLYDLPTIRTFCSTSLSELASELFQLHEQQVKIFTPQEYDRLACRILYEAEYEGPTARREARDIMHNWRNGVPTGKLEESRKIQIEQTKEDIRRTKHGVKLEQYVNLDDDISSQRPEFGRFLFNRRRDITRAELRQLILLVYCIYYYQKDAIEETNHGIDASGTAEAGDPEKCITLPTDFQQPLRDNQSATKGFYNILRKVEPYVNKGGASIPESSQEQSARYKDWTWYHLREAFIQLNFLPRNSSPTTFGNFIHSVFPHRTASSVQRSVYRNNNVNSLNIVADVVKEFQPVSLLVSSLNHSPSL